MIEPDSITCIYLQNPKEQWWGKIVTINQFGVTVKGIEIKAFIDWCRMLAGDEPKIGLGLSEIFFPFWRVEKIALDEDIAGIPSLKTQLEQRTGLKIEDVFV